MLTRFVAIAITLCTTVHAQDGETLAKDIVTRIDRLLTAMSEPARAAEVATLRDEIWRATAKKYGELGLLLRELERRASKQAPRARVLDVNRALAHYYRRLGDLGRAQRVLARIEPDEDTTNDVLQKAEVADALGRDKEALRQYDRLLARDLDTELRNKILLRKALMTKAEQKPAERRRPTSTVRPGVRRPRTRRPAKQDAPSALAAFAKDPKLGREIKNQAAIALALTGGQKDAIEIFVPEGHETARFRQEVRLADWAIEAGQWKAAQDSAWTAVRNAKLKRDRRYALTILVEAYRRDAKLGALIERFRATKSLDVESRETWIDLLRETGRVDEALRLFEQSAQDRFTTDMRRELLEICREADKDEVLENAYRRMIIEQPRFLEWREGLARFYLERGRRDDAALVWKNYLDVTNDTRYRMAAASTLMGLGLDGLAEKFARACMSRSDTARNAALMFLYELHKDRGRHAQARKALEELDGKVPPGADVRKDIADAYARLGDKKKAVEVLEGLYAARGDDTPPDTQMKLALMLSEVGEEDEALTHWKSLWRETDSIPRRRYVEERLMSVAARLGKLASVAIDLEKKLLAGTADDRDAGLLVRLYVKVNDPVSATEIIEEHMKRTGKKPVEVLTEKARVFQSCNDYYDYEQVINELIEVDPEGRPDYLRQLAMSHMERGQRKSAREILERLKAEESDTVSDEFEAGVLALAGMRREALRSYRRGIAKYPERIDTYLLLSNMQKALGRHDRSAGMFQYLAATAAKDDLFTIAVDGILNMRDGRGNVGAPNRLIEWTRRVVLERIARRPNKLYLYRLAADLSEEINDTDMAIRLLKAALPVAGEQRTQMLRELMAMAKKGRGRSSMPGVRILPSGVIVSRSTLAAGHQTKNADQLMFGRRILGQAELVPPEVYLELGEAFLSAGEVQNATKTFNQASQLPEFAEMRRKIAQAFEVSGYPKEALRVYEQILSVETGDGALITKVGELHEQTGRDEVAAGLYERGIELLLNRSVFAETGTKDVEPEQPTSPYSYYYQRNTDDWERQHSYLVSGLLATLSDEAGAALLSDQHKKIDEELARVETERKAGKVPADGALAHFPRLSRRVDLYERIATAFGRLADIDALDRRLLAVFDNDKGLLEQKVRDRLSWGYLDSARKLVKDESRSDAERDKLRVLTGGQVAGKLAGLITVPEASGLILPLLIAGDNDGAKALLERLDLSTADKTALDHISTLVGATVYLRDSDLTLALSRHWLNLAVRHSPGMLYQTVETILQRGRIALDKSQLESLTEYVLSQVVENPDKFAVFIRRLPELRKNVGPDFLTREQIEKVIETRLSGSDRFTYGIEDLIVMLAPEDQAPALRSIWNKLPKTQTAYFLLRLVSALDHEVDSSFAEFLTGAFAKALDTADDKRVLGYQVNTLSDGATNLKVRLRMIEIMAEKGEQSVTIAAGKAKLLEKLGRVDEAMVEARKVIESYATQTGRSSDPYARSAFYQLVRSFKDEYGDRLRKVFDEIEKRQGESLALTIKRLDFLAQIGQQDAILDELQKAVAKYPTNLALHDRLARVLSSRGDRAKALVAQAETLALAPKDRARRTRLEAAWRAARNPIHALAVRTEGEKLDQKPKPDDKSKATPAVVEARTPPPSVTAMKKALDAGDTTTARTIFRRMWRRFSQLASSNPYLRVYPPAVGRIVWPDTGANKPAADKPAKMTTRSRGGLPEMFTRELTKKEKRYARRSLRRMPTPPSDKDQKTVHDVLAGYEFGREEIERQLRSFPPAYLGSVAARDIYKALAEHEIAEKGRKQVLDRSIAEERAGRCGKVEYGLIAALLDGASPETLANMEQSLEGLTKNLNANDQQQLRRVARIYAESGHSDKAATLYRWCTLLGRSRFGYYYGANDLLNEVLENLKGEARIKAVEDVLTFSDPGEYNRDPYLRLVLETWNDLLDPKQAVEKSRRALAQTRELDMLPYRSAAKLAALMHARVGEIEDAIACLEIALCKLTPPEHTRYPWYRSSFESPGYLSTYEIAMQFPKDMPGFVDPATWLEAAQAKVSEWQEAGRINDSTALQIEAVIDLRLHEHGRTELAVANLSELEKLAGDDANQQLWIADVARLIGQSDTADRIERALFDAGRLHVERVPGVVAAVAKSDPNAALALGEACAKWTLHPELTKQLIAAADAAGKKDRAEHWRKVRAEAAAAEKTLIEQDKKRAEEAKAKASRSARR